MRHEEMKDLVFALRDGEPLAPEARSQAERHLAACGECREAVASWEKASKTLFVKPIVEPSEEFTRAVLRRVRSVEEPVSWTSRLSSLFPRLVVAGALAAAVAVMLAPRQQMEAPATQPVETEDESVYSLLEAETDGSELGTAIEEYFL